MDTSDIEMVKLYWEEFKYRHENYWKLFFKFSYAIIFLLVVPYVYPEKMTIVRRYVMLFPICGIFLSVAAAWILAAEYKRIGVSHEKMTWLKDPKYQPIKFSYSKWDRILKLRIGNVVTATFLAGFLPLSLANFIILLQSKAPVENSPLKPPSEVGSAQLTTSPERGKFPGR